MKIDDEELEEKTKAREIFSKQNASKKKLRGFYLYLYAKGEVAHLMALFKYLATI